MIQKLSYTMPTVFQLADLEKSCFGKDAWSIAALRGEFENSFSHMFGWVDEPSGNIVGYVCVRVMYEEAQVCNIAVNQAFRRQGIATALLAKLHEFCAESKCEYIELEVNTANVPAVELYKKSGYTVAGIRKNFYRRSRFATNDAYTMTKPIADKSAL